MNDKITYRKLNLAKTEEVAQIARIHAEAPRYWQPEYVVTPHSIQKYVEKIKNIEGKSESLHLIAETSDSSIVGFHWVNMDQEKERLFAYVISLWVHDEFQRRGLATSLKQQGEEWAKSKGATFMKTTVHSNNTKMLQFNVRFGYRPGFVEMIKEF